MPRNYVILNNIQNLQLIVERKRVQENVEPVSLSVLVDWDYSKQRKIQTQIEN